MKIQIIRVDSKSRLELLQSAWEELQADSHSQSIFLSWEWISAYLQYLNPSAELWVLLAFDPDQRLLGIAPLLREQAHVGGLLQVHRLRFIALEYDYHHMGFIVRTGYEEAVIREFIQWLRRYRDWDEMLLEGIQAESPVTAALQCSGLDWITLETHEYPYVSIAQPWEAYFASLSKSKRESQRRAWRRLDADFPGQWSWKRIEDPAELPAVMDRHMELHQKKWVALGEAGHYSNGPSRAFHHHIARRFLERGWLRLYQLTIRDEIVSVDYNFTYLGRTYGYARAMDDGYRYYALGNVLAEVALREAFEEGVREFDLLWGAHEYKLRWGAEVRETLVLSWPATPFVFLYRNGYQAARRIWIRLKRSLRARKPVGMATALPFYCLMFT